MKNNDAYNIVFVMTDQHRADHVGFLPGSKMSTPNIDRLAGSVGFSNCVSPNPVCSPARSALLTGKYPHQIGMIAMSGDLSRQHPTYLQALQRAGYWTAGIGKFHWLQGWPWDMERGKGHNLVALKNEIKQYGLDYVWESAGKQLAVKNYCDYCRHLDHKGLLERYRDHIESSGANETDPAQTTEWFSEPWPFDEEDYVDVVTGRQALQAIDARPADQPFSLFVSFCGPHNPYDPPASFLETIPDEDGIDFIPGNVPLTPETKVRLKKIRRAYKASIAVIDHQVGLILDKLEDEGLMDSTVIVFASDHGDMLGDHSLMLKMVPWHQSVVVPAAIRHPDYLSGITCNAPTELTDLTATILDIANLDPQQELAKPWPAFHDRVPCRSLMPVVRGDIDRIRDCAFSECYGVWQMIQTDRWKYIMYLNADPDGDLEENLFDLNTDPSEQNNLAGQPEHAAICSELREKCRRITESTPPAQTGWAPYPGHTDSVQKQR